MRMIGEVTKNMKTTVLNRKSWRLLVSFKNVPDRSIPAPMTYVRRTIFVSNITYNFLHVLYEFISKSVHTLTGPILCIIQKNAPIKIT